MLLETFSFTDPVELRSEPREGGKPRLIASGVAIRYGALSKNLGGYVERFAPGSATDQLEHRNINAFHEHPDPTPGRGYQGMSRLLGCTEAGTLTLSDTAAELRYAIDLPDTSAGRDAAVLLERRDIRGASVGFLSHKPSDKWTKGSDGLALRTVNKIAVLDHLALTCSAAYAASTSELSLRSFAEQSGLELRAVMEAAEARELGDLVASIEQRDDNDDGEQPRNDDGTFREPPPPAPFRRHITALYL